MHRAAPTRNDGREDELLRLQQENAKLKKSNQEQENTVKKLGGLGTTECWWHDAPIISRWGVLLTPQVWREVGPMFSAW